MQNVPSSLAVSGFSQNLGRDFVVIWLIIYGCIYIYILSFIGGM